MSRIAQIIVLSTLAAVPASAGGPPPADGRGETWEPPRGLEFLRDVPELRGISLRIGETEFRELVASRDVDVRADRDGDRASYWVSTASGANVVVMFRDGACRGIQRMRSEPVVPPLSQEQRIAIVAAANRAIAEHGKAERKADAPDEIDPALWGDAIAALKPIRVRNDRVNVAIVLSEKGGVEEGLYVSVPISSYAPRVGDRFAVLERLSADEDRTLGQLYRYKLRPKAE